MIKTRHTAETLTRALARHQRWLDRQLSLSLDTCQPVASRIEPAQATTPRRPYFRMAKATLKKQTIVKRTRALSRLARP